jgi:hypothetical protein
MVNEYLMAKRILQTIEATGEGQADAADFEDVLGRGADEHAAQAGGV